MQVKPLKVIIWPCDRGARGTRLQACWSVTSAVDTRALYESDLNRIVAQCKFGKFRKVLIRRCMAVLLLFQCLIHFLHDSTVRAVSVCRLLLLAL